MKTFNRETVRTRLYDIMFRGARVSAGYMWHLKNQVAKGTLARWVREWKRGENVPQPTIAAKIVNFHV